MKKLRAAKKHIKELVQKPETKFHISLSSETKVFIFIVEDYDSETVSGFGAIFEIKEVEEIPVIEKRLKRLYKFFN